MKKYTVTGTIVASEITVDPRTAEIIVPLTDVTLEGATKNEEGKVVHADYDADNSYWGKAADFARNMDQHGCKLRFTPQRYARLMPGRHGEIKFQADKLTLKSACEIRFVKVNEVEIEVIGIDCFVICGDNPYACPKLEQLVEEQKAVTAFNNAMITEPVVPEPVLHA